MRNRIIFILALGLVLGLMLPFAASAQVRGAQPRAFAMMGGPRVVPSNSVYFGKTYAEWASTWWQWAFSIPVEQHPLFDNGDCSVGQAGPVWFLGGKFCKNDDPNCGWDLAYRTCSVPAGTALFFPIANTEDSLIEDPGALSINQLRVISELGMDGAEELTAEVDGAAVPMIKSRFRISGDAMEFTLPEDNLLNAIGYGPISAGTYHPSVGAGYYILLSPLPVGQHTLHIHAAFPIWSFAFDIYYTLNVGGSGSSLAVRSTRRMVGPHR
jgi:hypothetical protein